jgi:hypothetical protein
MTASLRPGRDSGWLMRLTDRVLSSVAASNARITTHSSSWLHDLDQVHSLASPLLLYGFRSLGCSIFPFNSPAHGQICICFG